MWFRQDVVICITVETYSIFCFLLITKWRHIVQSERTNCMFLGHVIATISSGTFSLLGHILNQFNFSQKDQLASCEMLNLKSTRTLFSACLGAHPGCVFHGHVPLCGSHHPVHPWHYPRWSHQRHQVLPDPTVAESPRCKGIHRHMDK